MLNLDNKKFVAVENTANGEVSSQTQFHYHKGEKLSLDELLKAYSNTLNEVFEEELYTPKKIKAGKTIEAQKTCEKIKNPIAVVPVFGGTNSEHSLKRQLKKSGFEVIEVLLNTTKNTG